MATLLGLCRWVRGKGRHRENDPDVDDLPADIDLAKLFRVSKKFSDLPMPSEAADLHAESRACDLLIKRHREQRCIREPANGGSANRWSDRALVEAIAVSLYIATFELRRTALHLALIAKQPGTRDAELTRDVDAWTRQGFGALKDASQTLATAMDYIEHLRRSRRRVRRAAVKAAVILHLVPPDPSDLGSNDFAQTVRELGASLDDNRCLLVAVDLDMIDDTLEELAGLDGMSDIELVRRIEKIVGRVVKHHHEPEDFNYPTLILRVSDIRSRFASRPAWSWSVRWRCHLATLQAWLYLFAHPAAKKKEVVYTGIFLRSAGAAAGTARNLLSEAKLLSDPVKSLTKGWSMVGTEKEKGDWQSPPTLERLTQDLAALEVRVRQTD